MGEVLADREHKLEIVLELGYSGVTRPADEAANEACLVVVIDGQSLVPGADLLRSALADGAAPALVGEDRVVLCEREVEEAG